VVRHKGVSFVAADIPGLIEGASEGLGLGHDFLRHIERTWMIIHIVDMAGSEGRDPVSDYNIINKELKKYSKDLARLPQIVMANKMDLPGAEENLRAFIDQLPKKTKVISASALTGKGVDELLDAIIGKLETLPKTEPLKFEPFVYQKADSMSYEIVKADSKVYEVKGGLVSTFSKNITLDDVDSFNYFQKQLREYGVIKRLIEAGAKQGDTIIVGDVEFDFIL
jgi:GTP-binding protein